MVGDRRSFGTGYIPRTTRRSLGQAESSRRVRVFAYVIKSRIETHLEPSAVRSLSLLNTLRAHVVQRSDLVFPLDIGRVVRNGFGDPEINEFERTLDENKVGRFEVGMDDLLVMDGLDGFKHLATRVQHISNI